MTETTTQNASETKAAKGKTQKKAAKQKAVAPKPKKAAKPKKERPPREDRGSWKTFALRMPASESAALHKAAGPANASRVMRALALAFTHEDPGAFDSIVLEAKQLRS